MLEELGETEFHRYQANLQRAGSLISESLKVLQEYNVDKNWEGIRKKILIANLVGKGSTNTLSGIASAIRKRYFDEQHPLPNVDLLARFLSSNLSTAARIQTLFPYICRSDALVKDVLLQLIFPNARNALGQTAITKNQISAFIDYQSNTYSELKGWSLYLKKRWIQGILALLRDFGLMEKAPKSSIVVPSLRAEVFMFFFLGFTTSGLSSKEALRHEIWSYFLLNDRRLEEVLLDAQSKGWIRYTKAGNIIEIIISESMEGWLGDLG